MCDLPIAATAGRRFYDHKPTPFLCPRLTPQRKLLLVRRAKQPGYGLLGLPGCYQMRGETWQEVATCELLEETAVISSCRFWGSFRFGEPG